MIKIAILLFLLVDYSTASAGKNSRILEKNKIATLEELDFTEYILIKENPPYAVFYDPRTDSYVKIWETNLSKAKFFLDAYEKGFFNGIAEITKLILDKNNKCRGYITPSLSDKKIISELQINGKKIVDSRKNHIKFHELICKLKNKVLETGYFYFDLNIGNIVSDGTDLFLIDLNSIAPLRVLYNLSFREKLNPLMPDDYFHFLINLYRERYEKAPPKIKKHSYQ